MVLHAPNDRCVMLTSCMALLICIARALDFKAAIIRQSDVMALTLIDAPHGPILVGTMGEIRGTSTILFPIFIAKGIFN